MKQEAAHLGFYNLRQTGSAHPSAGFIQMMDDLAIYLQMNLLIQQQQHLTLKRFLNQLYSCAHNAFHLPSTFFESYQVL